MIIMLCPQPPTSILTSPWYLRVLPGANMTNVDAIAVQSLCNCTAMPPAPPTPPPTPVNASVPNLATLSLVLSTGNNNSVIGVCDALANTVAQALTLVRMQADLDRVYRCSKWSIMHLLSVLCTTDFSLDSTGLIQAHV
jgi:hypothetical protein